MELINPRITIQNIAEPGWLVRMEHDVAENEHIDICLKLPRSDHGVAQLQAQLMTRAIGLLQEMVDSIPAQAGT